MSTAAVDDAFRLLGQRRHRLLQQDRVAAFGEGHHRLDVRAIGGRDDHCVGEPGLCGEVFPRGEPALRGYVEFIGQCAAAGGVGIGDSCDGGFGGGDGEPRVGSASRSGTDDCQSDGHQVSPI